MTTLDNFYQRVAAALFATAILVVVTLTTLPIHDLDANLLRAVHCLAWSAALLGSVVVMSTYDGPATTSNWRKHPRAAIFRFALTLSGTSAWGLGISYVLDHFRIAPWESSCMALLPILSIIVAAAVHQSHLGAQNNAPAEVPVVTATIKVKEAEERERKKRKS